MKLLSIAFALFSTVFTVASAASLHNGTAQFGMGTGGFNFGVGYDYMYNQAQSLGGHFHYYSKDDKKGANGVMIIGATTGFHFFKGDWDFALTPSLDIVNIDGVDKTKGSKTGFGPGLSVGLLTALNEKVSLGFDFVHHYVWFGDDYRGKVIDDLNVKVRVGF